MFIKYIFLIVFVFPKIGIVASSKILAIIPTPFYSHQVIFQPIWSALSINHTVTVLTTEPVKNKHLTNLTEVDTSFLKRHNIIIEDFLRGDQNIFKTLFVFINFYMKITDDLMQLDVIKDIVNGSEKYDLLIYEQTFPILSALCLKMKSSCITVTPFELDENLNPHMSLPPHSAIYTNFVFPIYKNLTFLERCFSEVFQKFGVKLINWTFGMGFEKRMKNIFGKNYSLELAERNVDMVFINTDPVFSVKRPMLQNIVEFDGIGMKKKEVLPDDIRLFLNSNPNGTILMSLGSTIKTQHLDKQIVDVLTEVFAELPYNILWKSEMHFPNLTKNIKQIEWIPQNTVLSHKNVKLFINHAGLQSVSEALHSHTPLLVLPFCGDNARWAKMVEQLKIGITINKHEIDKDSFKAAINELILNPTYKKKMIELATISEDKQVNDLENVIWWIEYVIRHKGAKHLRSEILDLPWYKFYCADVYAFIVFVIYLLYLFFSYLSHFIKKFRFCNLVLYKTNIKQE